MFGFLQDADFSVQHADRGVPLVALAHRLRLKNIYIVQNTLPCTVLAAPYVYNRCLRMLSAGSDASTLPRSMHLKRSSSRWKSKALVGRGVLARCCSNIKRTFDPVCNRLDRKFLNICSYSSHFDQACLSKLQRRSPPSENQGHTRCRVSFPPFVLVLADGPSAARQAGSLSCETTAFPREPHQWSLYIRLRHHNFCAWRG